MEQRCNTAGVCDSQLYQRENSKLRSEYVISLRNNLCTVHEQGVELLNEIRIEVDEGLVEHLVEIEYIIVNRRQLLDFLHQRLRIALTYGFQNVILI